MEKTDTTKEKSFNDGRRKMKNERWKVHACLIGIVLAAVIIGVFYYYTSEEQQMERTGGVLVKTEQGAGYGC